MKTVEEIKKEVDKELFGERTARWLEEEKQEALADLRRKYGDE